MNASIGNDILKDPKYYAYARARNCKKLVKYRLSDDISRPHKSKQLYSDRGIVFNQKIPVKDTMYIQRVWLNDRKKWNKISTDNILCMITGIMKH